VVDESFGDVAVVHLDSRAKSAPQMLPARLKRAASLLGREQRAL